MRCRFCVAEVRICGWLSFYSSVLWEREVVGACFRFKGCFFGGRGGIVVWGNDIF